MATATAKKPKQVVATDMYTGNTVIRPVEKARRKYDFDFTKRGNWYYINSVDDHKDPALDAQKKAVTERGEQWRVVEALTGEIVDES